LQFDALEKLDRLAHYKPYILRERSTCGNAYGVKAAASRRTPKAQTRLEGSK